MLPVLIYQMFMVLPNSPTFIPAMGSQFSPPKLQVNYRSYAQAKQHPNIHACVPLNDGPRRYLEVYITPQNDNNDIINQDIFNEANLRAYPRSSLDDTAKIVHLSLTTSSSS